jgi:hypothetical protein
LNDTDSLEVYRAIGTAAPEWSPVAFQEAGQIVNVVSTTKTDTFSSASTSPTDITGLSVSITPKSTSSRVEISVSFTVANSSGSAFAAQLTRNGTVVGGGTTAGNRLSASSFTFVEAGGVRSVSFTFVDSPSSTSSVTYQVRGFTVAGTFFIGRSSADADTNSAGSVRTSSTITAKEISG